MILGVRTWALAVGMATVLAGFLGAMAGAWVPSPRLPSDPNDCASSVELITINDSVRHCSDGARLEVYPIGQTGNALIKCVCPTVGR